MISALRVSISLISVQNVLRKSLRFLSILEYSRVAKSIDPWARLFWVKSCLWHCLTITLTTLTLRKLRNLSEPWIPPPIKWDDISTHLIRLLLKLNEFTSFKSYVHGWAHSKHSARIHYVRIHWKTESDKVSVSPEGVRAGNHDHVRVRSWRPVAVITCHKRRFFLDPFRIAKAILELPFQHWKWAILLKLPGVGSCLDVIICF